MATLLFGDQKPFLCLLGMNIILLKVLLSLKRFILTTNNKETIMDSDMIIIYGIFALLIACVIFIIYMFFHDAKVKSNTINQSENEEKKFLKSKNFTISKEIIFPMPSLTHTLKFIVDDYSKRFGFFKYQSIGNLCELQVWNYKDLVDFNLCEDGVQKIPGRGLLAAGGALLFGVKGAIIGSVAGDKTIQNICKEMTIQMKVNDLNNPLISIGLLDIPCDKQSYDYKEKKKFAEQIIATLTYIETNKNTEPVSAPSEESEQKNTIL